jgi:hypothetical protein
MPFTFILTKYAFQALITHLSLISWTAFKKKYISNFIDQCRCKSGVPMRRLFFWMLTCLLGWTSLQANDASMEASCRPELIDLILKDAPAPFEPIFAFVYSNNVDQSVNLGTYGYHTSNPIIFNSKGPTAKITYDAATGELIIPLAGQYEITYSVNPFLATTKWMALAVNGKLVPKSEQPLILRGITTATIALSLVKGDRVSLSLPDTARPGLNLILNGRVGNSASLLIKKL